MIKNPLYIAVVACLFATSALTTDVKVMVKGNNQATQLSKAKIVEDYGSFKVYSLDGKLAQQLAEKDQTITIVDDMDYLLFDAFTFNTQNITGKYDFDSHALLSGDGSGLRILQFTGPIKQDWLSAIASQGVQLIHYVANNGYLVWVNGRDTANLNNLVSQYDFIQFNQPFTAQFKPGPSIQQMLNQNINPNKEINVVVQLANSPENNTSKAIINQLAIQVESPWQEVMQFHNTRITVAFKDIDTLLNLPDSFWVSEYYQRELLDEVQNIILTGDLSPDNSQPALPGYEAFLSAKGFSTNAADYPIVDVTDDGIGDGTVNSGDPTFHVGGDISNPTRLSYVATCTNDINGEGVDGHGHLNTNIVGGFESRVGFPYIDPNGYIRTQGVNPYTRIAGTRIFNASGNFNLSSCGGTDQGLIESVSQNGASIMSNSWGCSSCAGSYDDSSQAFDLGTRDADLSAAGNQPMIMVFAAGNSGPSAATVGTPGNGKNMITVGASENYRPMDEDGNWTDGCFTGPSGADNAMDVIGFSSRGPAPGGRDKPEIMAPGTHIHGTASTNLGYTGNGVCDQYRPGSQTVIAASSGTSHSTPAIAGVASLAYYWLENPPPNVLGTFSSPSPAMMKAYMVAHPTYLTGVDGNDDLPSNSQGYGMPHLDNMFDSTSKYLYDQAVVLDNTGETWNWIGTAADPAKPVRIVMTYTDAPGAVGTSPQVNNLDLTVVTGGNSYLGNVFSGQYSITGGTADSANNYEAAFFPAGTATDLDITVTAANIAGDGVPNSGDASDQDFALVCYNCAQSPIYTISPVANTVAVCSPDDASYQLNVGSILGYSGNVTLSATGQPAGSSSGFSNNPVTAPGSSSFTISNIGSTTPGNYLLIVEADDGSDQRSVNLNLDIFDQAPTITTLVSPANGDTAVSADAVSYSWNPVAGAQTYQFELATDTGFSNIIDSALVSTNSYTSGLALSPNTKYYWRVSSTNSCGVSTNSSVFNFTTLNEVCWNGSTSIPDNNAVGVDISLNLVGSGALNSMKVVVESDHTWPGDLIFNLTHNDTATTSLLMDRPGKPASTFGCSRDGIAVTFDDDSSTPVENVCLPSSPGIAGVLKPEQPLSVYIGEDVNGLWVLNASDNDSSYTGNITKFCLIPDIPPQDIIFKDGFDDFIDLIFEHGFEPIVP